MKRILFAALAIALASTAVWLLTSSAPPAVAVSPERPDRFPLDVERRYAARWTVAQSSLLPTSEVASGTMELLGHFTLTGRRVDDGSRVVVLRLDEVQRYEALALGKPLPSDGVAGSEAWVMLTAEGGLQSLRFDEGQSIAARYLLQGLAAELFAPTPDAPSLELKEPLAMGELATTVRWVDDAHLTLSRRRERFTQWRLSPQQPALVTIEASAELYFEPSGPLRDLDAREHVDGRDAQGRPQASREASFTVRFVGARDVKGLQLARASHPLQRTPGALMSEVDQRRAHLENRVGPLTFEMVVQALTTFDDPRVWNDRAEFVSRATAYFMLHPEKCGALVPLFGTVRSDQMRAQLLDLLAGAGGPEAQAAMRAMLTSPEATKSVDVFERFYPRLGFVASPTAETIKFVVDGHAAALHAGDVAGRRTRAFTLGNLAAKSTDPVAKALMVDVLLDDAVRAVDRDDLRLAYRALGNTGDVRVVEVVGEALQSKDTLMRADAVVALRRVPGAEAQQKLTEVLGSERELAVQRAALDALRSRPLTPEAMQAVRALTVERRLAPAAARELLTLVSEQQTPSPELVQAVQALLVMPSVAPSARVQARTLLEKLGS
ncbi:MAG: HEAT repeat domain-containing protein [Archangium sp.]|nr:HEAT repeat domain-containing protein [Archangium sp.]